MVEDFVQVKQTLPLIWMSFLMKSKGIPSDRLNHSDGLVPFYGSRMETPDPPIHEGLTIESV